MEAEYGNSSAHQIIHPESLREAKYVGKKSNHQIRHRMIRRAAISLSFKGNRAPISSDNAAKIFARVLK
jgi:hypothetical protein